jgi:hypothetical protein
VSKNKNQPPPLSSRISDVLIMMDGAIKDYDYNYNAVNQTEKLTQDFLHNLELGNLKYQDRAKVATKLEQCRKARRQHKDMVELLEPLIKHIESDYGKKFINILKEVLGKTRQTEEKNARRIYHQKVLDAPNIANTPQTEKRRG